MIDKAGLYLDIPEKAYHGGGLTPKPPLSSSIAKVLINQSPGHAWWEHPDLNKSKALEVEQSTKTQGMGTAIHKLILGKGRPLKVLNFDDYRTNAAKAARDNAIADGMTPLLGKEMDRAEVVAEAAKRRLADSPIAHLIGEDKGDAEVTGVWQEANGIWCKMRIDWLPHAAREVGHITVLDLKTTGQSAKADDWSRTMFDFGGDVQDALYRRGLKKLLPDARTIDFVFVVIEQDEPCAVQLCRSSGETREMAQGSVALAIETWGQCLSRGTALEHWPFYEGEIADIDPPVWRSMASELAQLRMKNRLAHWQRPLDADASQAA